MAGDVVERHMYVAQLGALRSRVEVGRVGAHPSPQHTGFGHEVAHPHQHLIGAVERRLRGGDWRAPLARRDEHDGEHDHTLHTAPAFIRSCKCTIPTTRRCPSSTGSAMIP